MKYAKRFGLRQPSGALHEDETPARFSQELLCANDKPPLPVGTPVSSRLSDKLAPTRQHQPAHAPTFIKSWRPVQPLKEIPSLDDWEKEWGGNSQRSIRAARRYGVAMPQEIHKKIVSLGPRSRHRLPMEWSDLDEEAGEMAVVLVCNRCPQREILPVR